jgi:calcineurin-like phosphoesterase family protein
MEKIVKPFDKEINLQLRDLYIKCLSSTITRPDGSKKQRAHHIHLWNAIPECQHPVDITEGKVWIWSDLHFGHTNVIKYSDRPFNDAQHMDELMIKNFNDLVGPKDISVWVGDVSFRNSALSKAIVRRLNGYKILIVGNHDFEKKKGLKAMDFDEVHLVYNLTLGDMVVAFTHYPMDNLPKGWKNCHGHVHRNGHRVDEVPLSKNHVNVNCEFLDYQPITLETLIEKFQALENS